MRVLSEYGLYIWEHQTTRCFRSEHGKIDNIDSKRKKIKHWIQYLFWKVEARKDVWWNSDHHRFEPSIKAWSRVWLLSVMMIVYILSWTPDSLLTVNPALSSSLSKPQMSSICGPRLPLPSISFVLLIRIKLFYYLYSERLRRWLNIKSPPYFWNIVEKERLFFTSAPWTRLVLSVGRLNHDVELASVRHTDRSWSSSTFKNAFHSIFNSSLTFINGHMRCRERMTDSRSTHIIWRVMLWQNRDNLIPQCSVMLEEDL